MRIETARPCISSRGAMPDIQPSRWADRIIACAGAVIVVAFFLPWLRMGPFEGPSGWSIAGERDWFGASTRALWLVPVLGLVMVASPALGEVSRVVGAVAGGTVAVLVIWLVARPLVPLEGGLAVALGGGAVVLVGDASRTRWLRAVGALLLAGSFALAWFGRTGYANTQPGPCPNMRVTVIPWGVVAAAVIALASAVAPQRWARALARSACWLALVTVVVYVAVAYEPLAAPLWATAAAGIAALLVAVMFRRP